MVNDKRFHPFVLICPYTEYGEDTMMFEMNKAFKNFSIQGYNVIRALKEDGNWIDIGKELKPDIIFFTNPYPLTRDEYQIKKLKDFITCYVPYGFKNSSLYNSHFNLELQNHVWRFFLETPIHQKLSINYSRNKGVNTVVTGYPGMDKLLDRSYQPKDIWKIKDKKVKRIIWAPHHTIPGYGAKLDYSTFLDYYDFMFQLLEEYYGAIQIAFKPHPVLRGKLNLDTVWGKDKTDTYFKRWSEHPYGMLIESDYIDLFLTSDALILDSSSFIIEYLYTGKPELFLLASQSVKQNFNEIGKMALEAIYIAKSKIQIQNFIEKVVINEHDKMKNNRLFFFNQIVRPPNNKTASENIFDYLTHSIFNK